MKDTISQIRKRLKELHNLNEESIKIQIVLEIFLENLGFDRKKWSYEESAGPNRTDMTYIENGKPVFLVETKALRIKNKIEKELEEKDVCQLLNYFNNFSTANWGLLTNGEHYILINKNIVGEPMDKIVFDLTINNIKKIDYWNYFSYENLFKRKTSEFMADIAQYKAYLNQDNVFSDSSWEQRWSTLFRFLNFYSHNHSYEHFSPDPHYPLSKIDIDDFYAYIDFTKEKSQKNTISKETIKNTYSYIWDFFDTLCRKNHIATHNFVHGRNLILSVYDDNPKQKSENYLNEESYYLILQYLWNNRNKYRNIVIFLLCAYYGFERSDVLELSWNNVDFKKNLIKYGERQLEMISLIRFCLEELQTDYKKNKYKTEKVIITVINKKASSPNQGLVNEVFNSLKNINPTEKKWRDYSPKYVKMNLASIMFKNGYSLEELMYFLNIDSKLITNYISSYIIIQNGKKRLNKKRDAVIHPFRNVTDEFYNSIAK